jgi:alpha-glucosidase
MFKHFAVFVGVSALVSTAAAQDMANLVSPSGTLSGHFALEKGRLVFGLRRGAAVLTEPAPLGIVVNGKDRGADLTGISFGTASVAKRRLELRLEKQSADASWREATLTARDKAGARLLVDVRVFDEGLAYRYRLPADEASGQCRIEREESSVRIPLGSTVWTQDYLNSPVASEGIWSSTPVGGVNGVRSGPVTVELSAHRGYLFISEAGNFGLDYSGSKYWLGGDRIQNNFAHDPQGFTIAKPNFVTPWRMVVAAKDLTALVNQTMTAALVPDPDPKYFPKGVRTDWVKPGRCTWSFFTRGYHEGNTVRPDQEEQFTDIAGQLGFEYNLVDAGWYGWKAPGKDGWAVMKDLVDRGRRQGVEQWAWIYYPLQLNKPENDWQQMREYLDNLVKAGVKGIEIDFLDSESQERRRFYDAALRMTAERKLMIQFHGANIPTGESHTWPHEMTREAIHGMENNLWFGISGQHYAAMPFTRMVAGHGCFTPGYLGHRQEWLDGSSWSLQLATLVAYNAALQQTPLSPDVLTSALPAGSPQRDLMRALPVAWDETRVLPGSRIGRYAAFARRKGQDWWVAVINGDEEGRQSLNLDFLSSGNYEATLVADVATKNDAWNVTRKTLRKGERIPLTLRASGGFVAWLRPRK